LFSNVFFENEEVSERRRILKKLKRRAGYGDGVGSYCLSQSLQAVGGMGDQS